VKVLTTGNNIVMADTIKNPINRVDPSANGIFHAFWREKMVYENGRVKRFETEREAWEYLARCDLAGKIIH
jgi:hypothetical protein